MLALACKTLFAPCASLKDLVCFRRWPGRLVSFSSVLLYRDALGLDDPSDLYRCQDYTQYSTRSGTAHTVQARANQDRNQRDRKNDE
jgi:hypothetical protein